MKNLSLLCAFCLMSWTIQAQMTFKSSNVATTSFVVADKSIYSANSTQVITPPSVFTTPISGAGTRLMWLPTKSAFRAGTVEGDEWDARSIGTWSFATGFGTRANSDYATAMGASTTASGNFSMAMGGGTSALSNFSTAMGAFTTAGGSGSTAIGIETLASGSSSTAMGYATTASGNSSTSMGRFSTAQAYSSLVIGQYNIPSGNSTTWVSTDPLFVIGNGTTVTSLNNALVVFKNGNVVIDGSVLATNFTQSSDGRFKKNIKALEKPLASILSIEGVRYDWRREEFPERHFSDKNQIGFIAQDLEKIFPEMVFTDEKGYKSVDYGRLTPVLVEAVKELSSKNEALKIKNEKVEARLEKLEALLLKTEVVKTK